MTDHNGIVKDSSGSGAMFSIVAVIAVAALIALFVWQPWNSTTGGPSTGNANATTTSSTSKQ